MTGSLPALPWLDPVGTSLWGLKNMKALLDAYIPLPVFATVGAAITKQCDAADGIVDGLIQNPAKCAFNPDALVPETLTQKQADALKLIMKPVTDEKAIFFIRDRPWTTWDNSIALRAPCESTRHAGSRSHKRSSWGGAMPPGIGILRRESFWPWATTTQA